MKRMNHIKRPVVLSIATLVMIVTLAACNSPEPTTVPVEAPPTTAPEVIEEAQAEAEPEEGAEASAPEAEGLNNIADQFAAPITAEGDLLIVTGRILDVNGDPVPDARIEFWQTDDTGVYDHPGDRSTGERDPGFQFYGSANALADGGYVFRTILPGQYEPRPRHIHVKVFQADAEVLTTQYYFASENPDDSSGIGGGIQNLLLTTDTITATDGTEYLLAVFDVIVNTVGDDGSLRLTDAQGEGPFYPVVDVSQFDNDLASVDQ